ncbi:MAG: hypothetical protein KDA69_05585 [Planctomycetaceae bacterium]|nr:hypothetical protein [Planctomycetaceae bacterium]
MASRREFLTRVGRGMLIAGLGYVTARELNLTPLMAAEESPQRLQFGSQSRLVDLLQSTPPDQFLPTVVKEIRSGVGLSELVGATALANARAFGGEDYIGFHTFMALRPALNMADQLPTEQKALPILKVLYRNAARLHDTEHHTHDTLTPVAAGDVPNHADIALRNAVHEQNRDSGDALLSGLVGRSPEEAWNDLLPTVSEAPEVHRIVLAHRAWDMMGLVGREHAETLLRQSVHYCINVEPHRRKDGMTAAELAMKVFDEHHLDREASTQKEVTEDWIEEFANTLLSATPEDAAHAVGAALAEGIAPMTIAEAVAVAANQLVLRDPGRPAEWAQPNKPAGSVHGDSVGVHASDTANAWRQIVAVSNRRNAMASLILAGWGVARDSGVRHYANFAPRPLAEQLEGLTTTDPDRLMKELDGAIREQNQERSCAVTQHYLNAGHSAQPVFDLLLKYACSEDGALHAEKYFWTVQNEYHTLRPRFRNAQLVALARVTSSAYGTPAPGVDIARELLAKS